MTYKPVTFKSFPGDPGVACSICNRRSASGFLRVQERPSVYVDLACVAALADFAAAIAP